MIKTSFVTILLFILNNSFAQNKFTGTIVKKLNEPIENANIVLAPKNSTQILAFAFADSKGFFEILYDGKEDSVTIIVSIIGYATKSKTVLNKTQTLNFEMVEQATVLPTVLIKEKPITQNGDTTNYLVKNFLGNQDRVIGDVIAKLPGVEIDEGTGQIKFNGKPISHYYIDGLDLLEKKYNIANRNIPADMVDQVQLLENHQDIKLLDSLIKGKEPALNIKLKKSAKNKLIGKAKIGVGFSPLLWDNELTGLQFNPSFQLITTYKNNNNGVTLSNELSDNFSIQKVGDNREKNIKEEIINKLNVQQPNLSTKRYLFNNTHLLHFNILKVLKNKAQLKFNLSFFNDNVINENASQSNYILPNGQQVNFIENRSFFLNTNKFETNTIYTLNTKKIYLKNIAKIKLDFTKENSTIINPAIVQQTLQNPFYEYSNDFLAHLPVKKKIISISSKINFNRMPQQLNVLPGQFKEVFNQSNNFEQISQKAVLNNFNTDNYISFFTKMGKVNQQIKIGTEFIHKNLQTSIDKLYNQTEYRLSDSFNNNINWNNLRVYATNETTIGKGKTQLDIGLPIELNILQTKNIIKKYQTASNNIFFNPNVTFSFPIRENITGDLSYNLQSSLGKISNISTGLILNNYRSINVNDSLLPLQQQHSIISSFYYKNVLKAIFSNVSISLSSTKKNIIYNQIFDGFFIKSFGSYLDNYQKSLIITGNTSKYFIESKINLALNYSYTIFESDLLQQNQIIKSNSHITSLGFKSNLSMLSYASFETNTKFDFFQNKIAQTTFTSGLTSTNRLQQSVKLYFYLTKKSTLFFNNEYYNVWDNTNNRNTYFLGDVGFKQKFKKTELEFELQNFTNSNTYITINNSENLKQINSYNIRPTTILVKLFFNF